MRGNSYSIALALKSLHLIFRVQKCYDPPINTSGLGTGRYD